MYFDLANDKQWPVGQGMHNETAAFFDGWRWMREEEYQWREEVEKQRRSSAS